MGGHLLLALADCGVRSQPTVVAGRASSGCSAALTVYGSDSTASQLGYLLYLPMFGIGALMAHQHERLSAAGLRLRGPTGFGVALAAIVLLMFSWTAQDQSRHAYRPALVVGAALLVFSFGYWDGGRSFGETRVLQWLGKRSFSRTSFTIRSSSVLPSFSGRTPATRSSLLSRSP